MMVQYPAGTVERQRISKMVRRHASFVFAVSIAVGIVDISLPMSSLETRFSHTLLPPGAR